MKLRSSRVLSITALAVITFCATAFTGCQPENKKDVSYLALGDSLAAGQTPYSTHDKGYPDFIAEKIKANGYDLTYHNLGISGINTSDMIEGLEQDYKGVNELIAEADLITIDIGGNDLINRIKRSRGFIEYDRQEVDGAVKKAGANLESIIKMIKKQKPDVVICVIGYYAQLPPRGQEISDLIKALNDSLQKAATTNGAVFIAIDQVISQNVTDYLPNPDDEHLSIAGYKAVADEVWKSMEYLFPKDNQAIHPKT
ncbi:MAG: hypothetical protein HPY50_06620 [Firmicutes bacterium]|nr:hypothetical protein [Bacillota bacterium]